MTAKSVLVRPGVSTPTCPPCCHIEQKVGRNSTRGRQKVMPVSYNRRNEEHSITYHVSKFSRAFVDYIAFFSTGPPSFSILAFHH